MRIKIAAKKIVTHTVNERVAQNKNTDWWQEEKIKEDIIKRKHLPEKILLEIQPSWWRGREDTLYFADWTGMDCTSKMMAQYTYLSMTPPYNLIG